MKITAIEPLIVNARMRNWIFVKVSTDEGLIGWGEASMEWKTRGVAGCIKDLEPFLLGHDPTRVEHLWQIMYRQPFFRAGVEGMSAISGIEQALWDICGKAANKPVYALLGGAVRDRVRMYDHLGGGQMEALYQQDTADLMAERASQSVADGYTAIKVLVVPRTAPLEGAAPLRHAETLMRSIREAVGPDIDIMVDLHGRTTPAMGIQYGQTLAPYRPFFLEEPCPPKNVAGMAEVARALPGIPIATGERLVTRWGFRDLLEQRACSVIQPDLCHCGGIWEARKIAALAETYFVSVAPHNPLGPLATAVAVHFALCTPNWLIQEAIRNDVPWRDDVLDAPLEVRGGHISPPTRPGWGVEINEAEAAKHPYAPEVRMQWFHDDGSVADW